MIIYGASLSPFVRKALAFAAEKGISVELQAAGMGGGPEAFKKASPFGKIPALEDGDFLLADSSAIVTYMEAVKPDPELIPQAARARAQAVWYDEFADTVLGAAVGAIFFNRIVAPRFQKREGDEAAAAAAERDQLPKIFAYLEGVLPASGHLLEDRLTLADIAVASPFVNLRHLGLLPDAGAYPALSAYVEAMHARPSFAPWIEREQGLLAR